MAEASWRRHSRGGSGLFLMLSGCEQFGAIPKGADHERVKQSENYDVADDRFVNRAAGIIDEMMDHAGFLGRIRGKI